MRVFDWFERSAERWPSRVFACDGERTVTYGQARAEVCAIAAAIHQARGSKVAVLAPNSVDALLSFVAIFAAGAIWIPANAMLPAATIAQWLKATGCDLLLHDGALPELVEKIGQDWGGPVLALAEPATHCDAWQPSRPEAGNVCTMFPTGGTTGEPKAALWTHRTWSTLTANFLAAIGHEGPPVHLIAAPITHAAGVIAVPLTALGATHILIPRAEPHAVLAAIARHRATTLFLPPTAIYNLLACSALEEADLSSLQNLIYAAAPMSVGRLREGIERIGPVFVQTFGQAEAPMVASILTREDHAEACRTENWRRLASCGRAGLLSDLAILDEQGNRLPAGSTGEIAVAGDLLMAGYHADERATAELRCGEWQRTGDLGHLDQEGFLYITDRKRDMIITGGFNVYPSELEQIIWALPGVQDCAVVGVPDARWGEAVTAVVTCTPGARIDPTDVQDAVRAALGPVKAPKRVLVWPDLPKSAVGKVLKRAIRERLQAEAVPGAGNA